VPALNSLKPHQPNEISSEGVIVMQNLILNVPNRVMPVANRSGPMAEQSTASDTNQAFEQVLNKQVSARQQKLNRQPTDSAQTHKKEAPKTATRADVKTETQPETLPNKHIISESLSNTEASANLQVASDMPNALELMWANVMTASALANQSNQSAGTQAVNALGDLANQHAARLAGRSGTDLSTATTAPVIDDSLKLDASSGLTESLVTSETSDMKIASTMSSLSKQKPVQLDSVIPDHQLPTQQIRWLDIPIHPPTDTSTTSGMKQDMPSADMPFDAVKATDLRRVEEDATKLSLKADAALALQTPIMSTQAPAQMANVVNSAGLVAMQTAGVSNHVQAYLGQSEWHQAISQKVMWMIGASEQTAVLTLNPPDLGPLQVVVSVNNDQADTTFISANPDVRQALQDGLSNLRDKLNESGLQLGQASINANLNSDGGHASLFSNERQQQSLRQAAQGLMAMQENQAQTHLSASEQSRATSGSGLVDTFV
jgi:flagellar hook-length control protein FliK